MYSIYVTNQCDDAAYARLSSEKMQTLTKPGRESSKGNFSFLSLGGFCLIAPGETRGFLSENTAAPMYVFAGLSSGGLAANFKFDPKVYGCITISSKYIRDKEYITVSPYNPNAVWGQAMSAHKLPSDIIKAGVGRNVNEHLYFGRLPSLNGGVPCAVTSTSNLVGEWLVAGSSYKSGELLWNTSFELIRAKRGDLIPPNAVMTGVTEADGSLFVGRVGGSIPCYITSEDGKIISFVYCLDQEKRVENGEIMVLTRNDGLYVRSVRPGLCM